MVKNKKTFIIICVIVTVLCLSVVLTACDFGVTSSSSLSAYDIAVKNGFTGTESEWLESLKGDTVYEESAYELAKKYGFTGTEEEWLASLKGEAGEKGETTTSNAVNKSILSVVYIKSNFKIQSSYPYYYPYGSSTQTAASYGSGVIFKDDKENGVAYIMTNYHVIYNSSAVSKICDDINIYLYGQLLEKYEIDAEYIGGSMSYDIAVLKITSDIYKNSNAYPATIGSSGDMSVGDTVIAIGNPDADGIAVTQGIVSVESEYINMTALDNSGTIQMREMRIDAAVNGGNSGGGLFNDSGELVGIVNAKIEDESIEGMAYAIPIDLAYSVVINILNNCEGTSNTNVKRCYMGFEWQISDSWTEIEESTGKVKIRNEISVKSVQSGAVVEGVLEAGDVLKSIRFKTKLYTINREYDITNLSLLFSEGDVVELTFVRNGISYTKSITLGSATTIK